MLQKLFRKSGSEKTDIYEIILRKTEKLVKIAVK